jgi:molybdopterin molybdotransferase
VRPLDDAVSVVLQSVDVGPSEQLGLREALGRVLAEDVVAPIALPPWTHAAMDGYAVRAADVSPGGSLKINELVVAGSVPTVGVTEGTATAVMTGTLMPEGADAVVVLEDTDGATEGIVQLSPTVSAGRHIRYAGEDVARGAQVLRRGATIEPAGVALLAALGVSTLKVSCRPRVGVLVTGDELVDPGTPLGEGQIYGSNAQALFAWVARSGGDAVDLGRVGDDETALGEALKRASSSADLVLTTGGASVGVRDMMGETVKSIGGTIDFWRVAMKPGKPVWAGRLGGGTRWLGLPGNPVSCMVGYLTFAHPWIRARLGDPEPALPRVEAVAHTPLRARPDRFHLVRVRLWEEHGQLQCGSAGAQGSGAMWSFAQADGIARIPPGPSVAAGERVEVQLLPSASGFRWSGRR